MNRGKKRRRNREEKENEEEKADKETKLKKADGDVEGNFLVGTTASRSGHPVAGHATRK